MALDGPEIESGDLAADLIGEFEGKFNGGADREELEHWADLALERVLDDLEREIWVSVCAQCFWEVGMLSPDFLEIYDDIVAEEAGINFWEKHYQMGEVRRKALDDLRTKISKPNPKPKIRQKYTEIETADLIFQPSTAVCWKSQSDEYRAAIIVSVNQHKGNCSYLFSPTTYKGKTPASVSELTHLFGTKIGYGFPKESAITEQPGIEKFWNDPYFRDFTPEYEKNLPAKLRCKYFTIGLALEGCEHNNLEKFSNQFTPIGSIDIAHAFKKSGSYGSFESFEDFDACNIAIDTAIDKLNYLEIPIGWIVG